MLQFKPDEPPVLKDLRERLLQSWTLLVLTPHWKVSSRPRYD